MKNIPVKYVDKFRTHILCSIKYLFLKSCFYGDNVENYYGVGQATDENMAQALCMLDT